MAKTFLLLDTIRNEKSELYHEVTQLDTIESTNLPGSLTCSCYNNYSGEYKFFMYTLSDLVLSPGSGITEDSEDSSA